ncbi:hypothetical protein [Dyadobacter sp. BHUBP1]
MMRSERSPCAPRPGALGVDRDQAKIVNTLKGRFVHIRVSVRAFFALVT